MTWQEIREQFPNKWVLVEALNAHSEQGKRIVETMQFFDHFNNIKDALDAYDQAHDKTPERELLVLHSSHPQLSIEETQWLGIRSAV
jgi:hypothetical protein